MARMSDAEWARMTGQKPKKKPAPKPKAKPKAAPKAKPKAKPSVKGAYTTLKNRGKTLNERIKKAGG